MFVGALGWGDHWEWWDLMEQWRIKGRGGRKKGKVYVWKARGSNELTAHFSSKMLMFFFRVIITLMNPNFKLQFVCLVYRKLLLDI